MQIGKQCCNCGADDWYVIDENYLYKETCTQCFTVICIDKRELVKSFECPDCGGLSGKPEENDKKFGIRCNNCGKLHIKINKNTMEDRRHEINETQNLKNNQPKCPKCGCTNIQIVKRKFSLLTGFATNKTDRVCVNCKYKW